MNYIAEICVAIIVGGIGYWWFLRERYRGKADAFKEILVSDIQHYASEETTLGATVLSLFPDHNNEFNKFMVYVPKRKKSQLSSLWRKYEEIYSVFSRLGVFGAVTAVLPHPDFGSSPEAANLMEVKHKKQIVKALSEIIEKL